MSKPKAENPMFLRIGEMAIRTGVSAKALRLYEKRGLLQPAMYTASGYRLYDDPVAHVAGFFMSGGLVGK